jgi:crotonobetainyl-CoA:carnitine CoA-transferase CaiB-like acyl-CoA transferase
VAHRSALHDELERALAAASAAHWVEVLTDAGVPAGLVNDVAEALAFADRLGLAPVVELGGVRSVANPIGIEAAPARYVSPPPRLDADHGADWHPTDPLVE